MEINEITQKVQAIVKDKLDLIRLPEMHEHLRNDLAADSLDLVVIIMECEKEFTISLPQNAEGRTYTVNDVVDLVNTCLNSEDEKLS